MGNMRPSDEASDDAIVCLIGMLGVGSSLHGVAVGCSAALVSGRGPEEDDLVTDVCDDLRRLKMGRRRAPRVLRMLEKAVFLVPWRPVGMSLG